MPRLSLMLRPLGRCLGSLTHRFWFVATILTTATSTCALTSDHRADVSPATDADFEARFAGSWGSESVRLSICPRPQGDFCAHDVCASAKKSYDQPCRDVGPRSAPATLRWTSDDSGCDAHGCETSDVRIGFAGTLSVEHDGCRFTLPVLVAAGQADATYALVESPAVAGQESTDAGPFSLAGLDQDGAWLIDDSRGTSGASGAGGRPGAAGQPGASGQSGASGAGGQGGAAVPSGASGQSGAGDGPPLVGCEASREELLERLRAVGRGRLPRTGTAAEACPPG